MMIGPPVVTCRCGVMLEESLSIPVDDRKPCFSCGSVGRVYKITLGGTVTLRSSLSLKARHAGRGKPFLEQKIGDSFSYRFQKWFRRTIRVDRDGDRYSESVMDSKTNEVIHKCEEPLSTHRDHGSAKKKLT
jgi:hypothetical protein